MNRKNDISRDVKEKTLAFVVTPSFHQEVKDVCEQKSIKLSGFLRTCVEDGLIKLKKSN